MASSPESFSRSLWWNAAGEAKPNHPKLNGVHDADVVIIGGGFTGLSSALFLAERGKTVVVLEARHVGFGASGRNGGQVIPGEARSGRSYCDLWARTWQAHDRPCRGAADLVFSLVREHAILCSPVRAGWIQAAHSQLATAAVHKRARQWQAQGVEVEILDREQIARLSGTERYFGGWRDPRAGALQPLDYARGLARAASARGVQILKIVRHVSHARKRRLGGTDGAWSNSRERGPRRNQRLHRQTRAESRPKHSSCAKHADRDRAPFRKATRGNHAGGVVLSETRKIAFICVNQ